jgi:hypothetical protein
VDRGVRDYGKSALVCFVILSEAKNLSSIYVIKRNKERFFSADLPIQMEFQKCVEHMPDRRMIINHKDS